MKKPLVRMCSLLLLMPVLLTGCWDELDLQDMSYITAIGIDYENGKMIMYAQLINFASVAKSEGGPQPGAKDSSVGRGEGKTALMAFYDLMGSDYSTLNLDHLKTVVIHERALHHLEDVMDALNRQRAARYTSYIFGTTTSIDQIFTTDSFLDQSPLYSILYMPMPNERQHTYVQPLQMQRAVQTFKEPSQMTFLPVINTSSEYWKKAGKPLHTQLISGIFVLQNYRFKGYFTEKSVIGLRWLNPDFHRVFMDAGEDDHGVTIAIHRVKLQLTARKEAEEPKFDLRLKVHGSVVEMDGSMTEKEIGASVSESIRKELLSLYEEGLEADVDFIGLEHHLYRYHNGYWRKTIKDRGWKPDKKSLANIDIDFNLMDSGKFDLRTDT